MGKASDTASAIGCLLGLALIAVLWSQHWALGVGGIVLLVIVVGMFAQPTECGICGNKLKKTSYKWELEGKKVRVCPSCNSALEKKRSREALKKHL